CLPTAGGFPSPVTPLLSISQRRSSQIRSAFDCCYATGLSFLRLLVPIKRELTLVPCDLYHNSRNAYPFLLRSIPVANNSALPGTIRKAAVVLNLLAQHDELTVADIAARTGQP